MSSHLSLGLSFGLGKSSLGHICLEKHIPDNYTNSKNASYPVSTRHHLCLHELRCMARIDSARYYMRMMARQDLLEMRHAKITRDCDCGWSYG